MTSTGTWAKTTASTSWKWVVQWACLTNPSRKITSWRRRTSTYQIVLQVHSSVYGSGTSTWT
jgi:hypothetical protein